MKSPVLKKLFLILPLLFSFVLLFNFFSERVASRDHRMPDYLMMHVVYALQGEASANQLEDLFQTGEERPYKCLVLARENADALQGTEHQERFEYFVSQFTVQLEANDAVGTSEVFVYDGVCEGKEADTSSVTTEVVCTGKEFECPNEYVGVIRVY